MCRLIAAVASGEGVGLLSAALKALARASAYDPYLAKATGGRASEHGDGWGLVAVGFRGDVPAVIYHRTLEPMFSSSSARLIEQLSRRLSSYELVFLLAHSRRSSVSEPYGEEFLHPFLYDVGQYTAWFAHNGGADKRGLARLFGLKPWLHVDSELLGSYIVSNALECAGSGRGLEECFLEAYCASIGYVVRGSALNSALLLLGHEGARLFASQATVGVEKGTPLEEYYRMVLLRGNGLVAVSSVTVGEELSKELGARVEGLEQGLYAVGEGGITFVGSLSPQ
ncbi:MAG: hypothetical protein ABWK00_05485 [Desulfurococcaceae archaeon]